MQIETRPNFFRLYVGKNSIGKTPTAIDDIIAYQKQNWHKKIIVHDSQDKFRDAHNEGRLRVDAFIPTNNKEWAGIKFLQEHKILGDGKKKYKWKDSLLVLDDLKMLFKGYGMPNNFLDLFALRPYTNMDMIGICHEPRNILEGFAGYISHFHIFANEASESQFEDKISCHVACQKASNAINKYVKVDKGYYDVLHHKPHFPHIIVNKENPYPLKAVNVDNKILQKVLIQEN